MARRDEIRDTATDVAADLLLRLLTMGIPALVRRVEARIALRRASRWMQEADFDALVRDLAKAGRAPNRRFIRRLKRRRGWV
ncbi:MAG: hypothetical protein ACPGUV_03915 [Polyangiales bacterium]